MITVNGHNFRTLNEPIYVNNRVVKQAWTGGKMVYPVGDYIKLKYYVNKTEIHSHDYDFGSEYLRPAIYPGHYGPCNNSFTVKGVAIAILKRAGNYIYKPLEQRVIDYTSSQANNHCSQAMHIYPCNGAEVLNTIRDNNAYIQSVKMKFRVSPIPVCGPILMPITVNNTGGGYEAYDDDNPSSGYNYYHSSTTWNSAGDRATYIRHLIEPVNQYVVGMGVFNDWIFAYDRSNRYESGEHVMGGTDATFATDGSYTNYGQTSSPPYINISFNPWSGVIIVRSGNFYHPVNITRIDGVWEGDRNGAIVSEERTNLGVKYALERTLFRIPATKILYSGDEADAPLEARTISSSELNLD